MEALHKDGKDDDHHKIGGMMVEFMVEQWWSSWWSNGDEGHYDSKGHTIHNLM
jgi:hypothetical protein